MNRDQKQAQIEFLINMQIIMKMMSLNHQEDTRRKSKKYQEKHLKNIRLHFH